MLWGSLGGSNSSSFIILVGRSAYRNSLSLSTGISSPHLLYLQSFFKLRVFAPLLCDVLLYNFSSQSKPEGCSCALVAHPWVRLITDDLFLTTQGRLS